ncbi:acyl-CoA dehydrogenase family protein [Sphingobium sp.]|uniref:acyl-CoA dehydrogenase family protein n=1 Tax=Sphingobium sp. TaxID=1912891 RepID=UPI0028BF10D3|nr:acyl-CoA dehydrogenase family protein [Sphingobium sp.]
MGALQQLHAEDTAEGQKALRDELVARATALVPQLRAGGTYSDANRRLPEESVTALHEAGLFRIRTPKRFGGLEADLRTYHDVVAEIGRGCGSAAWVAFISNATVWIACHLGEQAVEDIFSGNPDARFIGLFAPLGTATKVEGGYKVNGKWPFASGSLHADWALLSLPLPQEDGTFEQGVVVMPMNDLTVEDTWFFAGMRGTGSNTVIASDVFVPTHRTAPLSRLLASNEVGQSDKASFREAFAANAVIMLGAPVIGLARAALELTLDRVNAGNKRISYSSYADLRKSPAMQVTIAEAASMVEMASASLERWCDEISDGGRAGEPLSFMRRAQMRVDLGRATQMARQAVNKLLDVQGASAFADDNPLQRVWRDIEFATRHGLLSPEVPLEILARGLFGDFEPLSPLV